MSRVGQRVESNLNAGQKLLKSGQYKAAKGCIAAGLKLAEQHAGSDAALTRQIIQLKLTTVWLEHACGNVEKAQALLLELHEQCRSLHRPERTTVGYSLIQLYAGVNDDKAVYYAKETLSLYDWRLNERPSQLSMITEILHTRLSLKKYRNRMNRLQNINDEQYEALCKLMVYLQYPLLVHNGEALIHLYARFIRYGLARGLNESLALIIGIFEQVVYRFIPRFMPIIPLGLLSSLQAGHEPTSSFPLQIKYIGALSNQVANPLEASAYLVQTMSDAVESTEINLANLALLTFLVSYSGGMSPLRNVLDFFDKHLHERTSPTVRKTVNVSRHYVRALQNEDDLSLFIAAPSPHDSLSALDEDDNYSCGCKLEAAYLSGHYHEALYWAQRGKEYELEIDWIRIRKQRFYAFMAYTALYSDLSEVERKKISKKLRAHLHKMRSWGGALGYGSAAYLLLAAEWKRLAKKPSEALADYMSAIVAAKNEKHGLMEGIACERLAHFYEQDLSSRSGAMVAMLDACAAFSQWGVTLKVTQIRTLHADLLRPMSRFHNADVLEGATVHVVGSVQPPDDATPNLSRSADEHDERSASWQRTATQSPAKESQALLESLTVREMEILATLAEGLSNRDIAEKFGIAETTVKTHTTRIFGKLEVKRRGQAVVKAKALGLLQ